MRFGNKGPKACQFSCIGFGNCVRACQFDAMHIVNGVAVVDREKCTSCMACASACPKQIIQKVPYEQRVLVGCRSNDKGAQTRKLCDAGCIGCMKCQRECPHEAIKVENNVAGYRLRQMHRLRPLRRGLPEADHPPAEDIRPGRINPSIGALPGPDSVCPRRPAFLGRGVCASPRAKKMTSLRTGHFFTLSCASGVFPEVHAPGKNGFDSVCGRGRKLCEAFQ